MEAKNSVRVGVHLENAISPTPGGLAALLLGRPTEGFASLLDGEETVKPEPEGRAPLQRKQADADDQTSHDRKREHARNTRSSEDHGDSTGSVRAPVITTTTEVRPRIAPQSAHWGGNADGQSVGISDGQDSKTEFSVESSAMRDPGGNDIDTARSRTPKAEERSALPTKAMQPAGTAQEIGDATKRTTADWSSSSWLPGSGELAGPVIASKVDGDANGVSEGEPAIRSDDAGAVDLESRNGSRFTVDLARWMWQDPGTAAMQSTKQLDLSSGGGDRKLDRAGEVSQSDDGQEIGAGGPVRLEVHGGQTRHDTPDEMFEVAKPASASTQSGKGAAVELVNAGQGAAAQRGSVFAEGTPNKAIGAGEPSPREAVMQHAVDVSTARMLANAMRGELHVGLHTEAFGRVTIQTNTEPGQLSAQVSLEDSKQSAALAAHLPAAEQRILEQHGLTASVRIVSRTDAGFAGGSTGNGQGGSGANDGNRGERRGVRAFEQGIERASRLTPGEITRERPIRSPWRGLLDVTV